MYKRFKRLFDKEEGYILVTSFMVLIVIIILGVTYANLAITQARQAEQHNDRKQAYYYARSGAERAYLRMEQGLTINSDTEKYFGNFSWNLDNGFVVNNNLNTDNINSEKKINVLIDIYLNDPDTPVDDKNDIDIKEITKIEVKSFGRKDKVVVDTSANYILTPPNSYEPPNPGEYPDNPKLAQDKDWVSGGSGNINDTNGDIYGESEESIIFRGPGNSLSMDNNEAGSFKAKVFYFDDGENDQIKPIQIPTNSKLDLYSDELIFYIDVKLKEQNNQDNGKLCLNTSLENNDEPGFVYFGKSVTLGKNKNNEELIVESGPYNFPNEGICLPEDKDELEPYFPKNDISDWNQIWE